MKWLRNQKIATRLVLAFSAVLVLMLITGLSGIVGMKRIEPMVREMYNDRLIPALDLSKISTEWYRIRVDVLKIVTTTDASERDMLVAKQSDLKKGIDSLTTAYKATYLVPEEQKNLAGYDDAAKRYWAERAKVIELAQQGMSAEALAETNGSLRNTFHEMMGYLDKLCNVQRVVGKQLYVDSDHTISTINTGIYTVVILAILLVLLLARLITLSINRPVQALDAAARRVAGGDLDAVVAVDTTDEIGSLAQSFNQMVDSVRSALHEVERKSLEAENAAEEAQQALVSITHLTSQVRIAAQEVAQYTGEISASVEQMAAGAIEQASQTAEVAAATEEMAQTISETAQSVAITAQSSEQAGAAANAGYEAVTNAQSSMETIVAVTRATGEKIDTLNAKVEEVGSIAEVINEIADQTNLLALNAAIEAARAGTHGRGFAVVADEVRKLAERTAKATKEISVVLRAIQLETQQAHESMEKAGEVVEKELSSSHHLTGAFERISRETDNVKVLVNQIAVASEEQSSTMSEVSKTLEGMRIVSEQSAEGVNQIAQATTQLNTLMENLQSLVDQFSSDEDEPAQKSVYESRSMYTSASASDETYYRALPRRRNHRVAH